MFPSIVISEDKVDCFQSMPRLKEKTIPTTPVHGNDSMVKDGS